MRIKYQPDGRDTVTLPGGEFLLSSFPKELTSDERGFMTRWGPPIRFVARSWRQVLGDCCIKCNARASTLAHRIPYDEGVREHGLHPAWLFRRSNVVPTCGDHNKAVEQAREREPCRGKHASRC